MENKLEAKNPLIATPAYATDPVTGWLMPFEGTVEKPERGHDDIVRAFPENYDITATQYSKGMYDRTPDAFTWTDGERQFVTSYCGDSEYFVAGKLNDGLYVRYRVDTCLKGCGDQLGNMIAAAVLEAMEAENEFDHVIEFDEYGNEHIRRGGRNLNKVSKTKLLAEKATLEKRIRLYEQKREEAPNKGFWDGGIMRRKLDLREIELMLDQMEMN